MSQFLADNLQLTAPAPTGGKVSAEVVGAQGIEQFFYWVVTNFPIGAVLSGPAFVRNGPQFTGLNHVKVVWDAALGANDYDVLRTSTPAFENFVTVATRVTTTTVNDFGTPVVNGSPLLPFGAPVNCYIELNNRDYSRPTLKLPCWIAVSTIVFPDGTSQSTAGGGGGGTPAPPNQAVQFNNNGVFGGSANFTWDNANGNLNVAGPGSVTHIVCGSPTGAGTIDLNTDSAEAEGSISVNALNSPVDVWTPRDPSRDGWALGFTTAADNSSHFNVSHFAQGTFVETTFIYLLANGNLGIGPNFTTAAHQLDVSGDINASGFYRLRDVIFANANGAFVDLTGGYVTANLSIFGADTTNYNPLLYIDTPPASYLQAVNTLYFFSHGTDLVASIGQSSGTSILIPLGGGSQTPWTSNIDGAGFNLNNAGGVYIGAGAGSPNTPSTNVQFSVFSPYGYGEICSTSNSWPGLTIWTQTGVASPEPHITLARDGNPDANQSGPTWWTIRLDNYRGDRLTFGTTGNDKQSLSTAGDMTIWGKIGISYAPDLTLVPPYALDVQGDINATGIYRISGIQIASDSAGLINLSGDTINVNRYFYGNSNLFTAPAFSCPTGAPDLATNMIAGTFLFYYDQATNSLMLSFKDNGSVVRQAAIALTP